MSDTHTTDGKPVYYPAGTCPHCGNSIIGHPTSCMPTQQVYQTTSQGVKQ